MEMREISVREANQNFSRIIADAENGETIIITKHGVPVASIVPRPADRSADPRWRAAYDSLQASLRSKPPTGFRVGAITEDDLYGDDA
jgi:prevent-host-death family protein